MRQKLFIVKKRTVSIGSSASLPLDDVEWRARFQIFSECEAPRQNRLLSPHWDVVSSSQHGRTKKAIRNGGSCASLSLYLIDCTVEIGWS